MTRRTDSREFVEDVTWLGVRPGAGAHSGLGMNERMRHKIRLRQDSDLRVNVVAAIRVGLTARRTFHFETVGRIEEVSARRIIRTKEKEEDVIPATGGFAVDDPIYIFHHSVSDLLASFAARITYMWS